MVFGFGKSGKAAEYREIDATELHGRMQAGAALVVDVREAHEFASGHIPGALNLPLSTFQPSQLPEPGARTLVLTCLGGKRSAMALDKCAAAQSAVNTHLAGGFSAWVSAGLPVER